MRYQLAVKSMLIRYIPHVGYKYAQTLNGVKQKIRKNYKIFIF
jgi:hypothetical protein